jgi:UDP-N-acetylmuramyl pentapeptide phosphotransferase/UDP-N-acetylglucosamine-1-phosphate transferase
MLYYLALALRPYLSALNVFTYHTVRAGAAAFTAFGLCLFIGPVVIRWLRCLKIGQFIRKDHVEELHALHKGKAGTPTMGGALILLGAVASLFLWGQWTNRLLIVAVGVFCALGAVGFLDDYIKLRRKHNKGLSAQAKFAGQILVGTALGIYLVWNPITVSATYLTHRDVVNWRSFVENLVGEAQAPTPSPGAVFWPRLSPELQKRLTRAANGALIDQETCSFLLAELNELVAGPVFYDAVAWNGRQCNGEAEQLLTAVAEGDVRPRDAERLNRLSLEAAYPQGIARSMRNLHTKVEIPGLKNVLLPMGALYAVFVLVIIVGSSNAVNLTDGLDGLAIGVAVVSLTAYTAIAYVVSRVDWSDYLFLIYVPEASELTVFGAALLGAGLGFLWFNSHPAEVFMGDTGSLALGGAIGTLATLTKQELLLLLVGGLFVLEAMSVIIQVASFQLRGKRVFRMAPLHHHFELMGWSESKVTIRFWILAILFALLSLSTLKLR